LDTKAKRRNIGLINKRRLSFKNFASLRITNVNIPKPWLKRDVKSRKKNAPAEEVVDPNKRSKVKSRMPAAKDRNAQVDKVTLPNCGLTQQNNERIVNGKDAAPGAYPWTVVILKSGDAWCAGTILNELWV
jgi:hypothetical protein